VKVILVDSDPVGFEAHIEKICFNAWQSSVSHHILIAVFMVNICLMFFELLTSPMTTDIKQMFFELLTSPLTTE